MTFAIEATQPAKRAFSRIQINVKLASLRIPATALSVVVLLAGCTERDRNPSPEEIRQQTAQATATAARDAKAVVQGVVDGVKQDHHSTVNINHSSADDLKSLPGIDDAAAQRIIAHRPYSDTEDLVKRHVVSHDEYDRISGKIEAH